MHQSSKRIKPEEFREWNEKMLAKYDPDAFHHHSNFFIRFTERKRVKVIFRMMNINKNDDVIEIGCGAGNVIQEAPPGRLFGMDIGSSVLRKAKERLNEKVRLFQGDAQNLPCKDGAFAQIICSEVLEHLLNPSIALDEMARVLKTRGTAIISIPNESLIDGIKSILIRLGIFKWLFQKKGSYSDMPERMSAEWHLHAFKLKEWLNLFRKVFRVTSVKKIPFPWLPLRYVIALKKKDEQ